MKKKLFSALAGLLLVGGMITPAVAVPGAVITASFSDACTDFHVDSSKDISFIEIFFADGTSRKIEFSAEEQEPTYDYSGNSTIGRIVVKSGTTKSTFECQVAPTPPPQCSDGIDNDGDGKTDYSGQDPGCPTPEDDDETNHQCKDGIDNDADGKTDFPDDPECENFFDQNEAA